MVQGIRRSGKTNTLVVAGIYAFFLAAFMACEEEQEATPRDPSVEIFLLNKDSLNKVTSIIDSLDVQAGLLDSELTELASIKSLLEDSLIVLIDSIANGGELTSKRDVVINDLDTLNNFILNREEEDSIVNVSQVSWTSVMTTINSGAMKIEAIVNNNNEKRVTYNDSSTNWQLPLDMNADAIDLNIIIEEVAYQLSLSYERTTVNDEKNIVRIKTSEFEILESTFDSARVTCQGCDDSETTIYVEF